MIRPTPVHAILAAVLLPVFTPAGAATAQQLTLGDAIGAALDSHPTISAATARLAASREAATAARGARLPGVSAGAALTRFQEPMVVAPLHAFDPLNPPTFDQTLAQAQLTAQYTLFDGGERGSRIRGGEALADAASYAVDSSELEVIEQVVGAYLAVLSARAVREAAVAQLSALEEERGRVQTNLDAGSAAEVELLRADATLQGARAQDATATARVSLAERALARASGIPLPRVAGQPLVDVTTRAASVSNLRTVSPLVGRAGRAIEAAEARLAEQQAGRLPRAEASAAFMDFGTINSEHVVEWQAGLRLSWPLFTGGARSAAIRRARADVTAAQSDLAAVELRLAQEIDMAETAATEAEARTEALAAAVAQWEEVARIERLALDAGSGVQRDLLTAQAGLFQARAGHAQARYDTVLAHVRLAKATGALDATWIEGTLEIRR